jgi:hypothetical protein
MLALVLAPGLARAATPFRPTCIEAQNAARITMGGYATDLDGRLVVGPCAKRGAATMITRVRIVGGVRSGERFRVFVTGEGANVIVRARPI